jgi:class 3 adenylate cyclase
MEDIAVVLDAAGSERAILLANDHVAFVACMFAATYPERVAALVLSDVSANYLWSEETPWEFTEEEWAHRFEGWSQWSRKDGLAFVREHGPSMADDREYVEWWYRYCLLSEGLGAGLASTRKYMRTDIRPILPSVHVPVLVILRPEAHEGHRGWVEASRFVARRVPGARLVELSGADAALWLGDQGKLHREIDAFLREVQDEQAVLERVLATVLFTDIVASTEKLAELGNAGWRELVERHHAAVRALIERFRGREVDTAGDGFYATFDGPARAIRCAQAIVEEVKSIGIEVRAGLHTGECEVIDGKVGGLAVSIGARVAATARPSEVYITQTVKDLVIGSGLEFEDRGEHELKGVDGAWRLYRVLS